MLSRRVLMARLTSQKANNIVERWSERLVPRLRLFSLYPVTRQSAAN